MKHQPLVTIITNTKNRANLISRCIESIQKQTYQNYEHIIADGGTDNTEAVVKSYQDKHIKYIKVPVGGPIKQTKAAFEISRGDYITFLDDDDEYLPEKLFKQLELIQSLPEEYGFIYGSMSYFDNNSKEFLYDHTASIEGGKEILPLAIANPVICGTPTLMFRRKVFEAIGGTWISDIGNEMSDWALSCKAIAMGWKVGALKESYLKIYVNHNSVRMSDSRFYKDNAERYIKFHNYFLNEYSYIIENNPISGVFHYQILIRCYISHNRLKDAYGIWKKLMNACLTIKNCFLLPYYLFQYIMKKSVF